MRIDRFLKETQVIKRRALAHEACEKGAIRINGRPAKPSGEVKSGDVVTISMRDGERVVTVRILEVPENGRAGSANVEVSVVDTFGGK